MRAPLDDRIAEAALALAESVSFDVNGIALPTGFAGGHGGMVSDQTIRLADEVRRLVYQRRKPHE